MKKKRAVDDATPHTCFDEMLSGKIPAWGIKYNSHVVAQVERARSPEGKKSAIFALFLQKGPDSAKEFGQLMDPAEEQEEDEVVFEAIVGDVDLNITTDHMDCLDCQLKWTNDKMIFDPNNEDEDWYEKYQGLMNLRSAILQHQYCIEDKLLEHFPKGIVGFNHSAIISEIEEKCNDLDAYGEPYCFFAKVADKGKWIFICRGNGVEYETIKNWLN